VRTYLPRPENANGKGADTGRVERSLRPKFIERSTEAKPSQVVNCAREKKTNGEKKGRWSRGVKVQISTGHPEGGRRGNIEAGIRESSNISTEGLGLKKGDLLLLKSEGRSTVGDGEELTP